MFNILTFTGVHTWLSLVAIATGLVVVIDLFRGRTAPAWTAMFLITAVLTSATGYGFPFTGLKPSHVVGAVALVVLAAALAGLYVFALNGVWRGIYAAGAVISLYLLVFVALAQAFAKVPALQALAPTQSEPPFALAQGVLLLVFIGVGIGAVRRFRPAGLGRVAPA